MSVESINGKVDKQIAFSKGQYVYITYVTNSTTAVSLIPEIKNDSEIVVTNENGEIVDINNLPVIKRIFITIIHCIISCIYYKLTINIINNMFINNSYF